MLVKNVLTNFSSKHLTQVSLFSFSFESILVYLLRENEIICVQVGATLAASTLAMIVGANVALSSSIIPILLRDKDLVQDFTQASWIGNFSVAVLLYHSKCE